MSEDSLKIEFISENLADVDHRKKLENIYWKHIPKDEIGKESSIEYVGDKAIFYSAFYSTDAAILDPLVCELEKNGAKELIATAWYDRVGEEMYYVRRNDRLLGFETIEEMRDYLKDAAKGVSSIDVNYGKNNRENTLLIRLHVKAKGKRKKIFELFTSGIESLDAAWFKEEFNKLIKSDSHDIEWCKFKWKEDKSWSEVCSEGLSNCITDAINADEYLILAFNLDKINSKNVKVDDFIWFVFLGLDGVKKVWAKYRPINDMEQYLHYPGMGDESFFVDKEIPDDNDWPKL